MSKRIPIKVHPDSIVRAIFQIRFKLNIPDSELLGKLYPILTKKFPKVEHLNNGIPNEIVRIDPQFRYMANFAFSNDEIVVSLGSNVLNFELKTGYKGWDDFYSNINDVLLEIDQINIFDKTERLGLRYINVINGESTIDQVVDLKFRFDFDENYKEHQTVLKKVFKSEGIQIIVNISENATVKNFNSSKKGILIDLDVSKSGDLPNVGSKLLPIISEMHLKEKIVFFNILKQDYIDSLKPEY